MMQGVDDDSGIGSSPVKLADESDHNSAAVNGSEMSNTDDYGDESSDVTAAIDQMSKTRTGEMRIVPWSSPVKEIPCRERKLHRKAKESDHVSSETMHKNVDDDSGIDYLAAKVVELTLETKSIDGQIDKKTEVKESPDVTSKQSPKLKVSPEMNTTEGTILSIKRGTIIIAAICASNRIVIAADKQETTTLEDDILSKGYDCDKLVVSNEEQVISACGDSSVDVRVMDRFIKECKSKKMKKGLRVLKRILLEEAPNFLNDDGYTIEELRECKFVLVGFHKGNPRLHSAYIDSITHVVERRHEPYLAVGSGARYAEVIIGEGGELFGTMTIDKAWKVIQLAIAHAMKNDEYCGGGIDKIVLEFGEPMRKERIEKEALKQMVADAKHILFTVDGMNRTVAPSVGSHKHFSDD